MATATGNLTAAYSAAAHQVDLNDGLGVVLPVGVGKYSYAAASAASTTDKRARSLRSLTRMKSAGAIDESLAKRMEANLTVFDNFIKQVGGAKKEEQRANLLKLIQQLKECNPGDFLITREDQEELSKIHREVFESYLKENHERLKGKKENLTLNDEREINQRIQKRLPNKTYRMLSDPNVAKAYLAGKELDAEVMYEAALAEKIYPTLDAILKDQPIYILEFGNNDIYNNMQTYLLWKVIHIYLEKKNKQHLLKVVLVSFGGHPQVPFDAHIEVETSQQICARSISLLSDKRFAERIFILLEKAADKFPVAKAILGGSLPPANKLEALLENRETRGIFRAAVGPGSTILLTENPDLYKALHDAVYFFRGVGESTAHAEMIKRGGSDKIPILKEEHSRNTGENVQFFEQMIPSNEHPIVIPVDYCPVGRQVVTYTHQGKKWSTVFTTLLDFPMESYANQLTTEQLCILTASYYAELARNILYRNYENFVSGFPIKDRNFDILWNYYVKLKPEDATSSPPEKKIFDVVKGAFVQFENCIPHGPVNDTQDPFWPVKMVKRVKKNYWERQMRAILTDPKLDPTLLVENRRSSVPELPIAVIAKALKRRNSLPASIRLVQSAAQPLYVPWKALVNDTFEGGLL